MRRLPIVLTLAIALTATSCGESDEGTPAACLGDSGTYLRALDAAPGEVILAAATRLNAEARAEPGGAANVQLGYLIGAAQAGAEGTDGIHAELMRRLIAAATYSPDKQVLSKEFERAYREGFDAGLADG